MPEAYIVDAVRTPLGRKKGSLAGVHPADLGGHVLKRIVERNRIDPLIVEDVVFGCVDTIGPQAGDRQVANAKAGITANQGLFGHGSSVIAVI